MIVSRETNWRTIDTAPHDGTSVLVCYKQPAEFIHILTEGLKREDISFYSVTMACYVPLLGGWVDVCEEGDDTLEVTHWQPLPEPPDFLESI